MNCPICNQSMKDEWVTTDSEGRLWFTGRYRCPAHGEMRLSGKFTSEGLNTIMAHIPECPNGCGVAPVIQLSTTRWSCCECGSSIHIRTGRLVAYPSKVSGRIATTLAAVCFTDTKEEGLVAQPERAKT